MTDNVTGRTYLERGKPVLVLARWSSERAAPWAGIPLIVLSRANGKPPARRGPHRTAISDTPCGRCRRDCRRP
jgi:hypothetical protein